MAVFVSSNVISPFWETRIAKDINNGENQQLLALALGLFQKLAPWP
jgi:hypothetical protein